MDGGYDDAYRGSVCLWGYRPGSLLFHLESIAPGFRPVNVLDAGCGEGKNAVFCARNGAVVWAVDISAVALERARRIHHGVTGIRWEEADIRRLELRHEYFDLVIAYGLLHCFDSREQIVQCVRCFKAATRVGGFNLVCALNDRYQELGAHPRLNPCLIEHRAYEHLYTDWQVLASSDSDLSEVHPHIDIRHTHSLTRLVAQKGSCR